MASHSERKGKWIDIPNTDMWTTLFDRADGDRKFPDDQKLYIDPITAREYTYTTLRLATLSIARSLRRHFALRKGDVLALFLQNGIDTPALTFGTLYLGAVVSPANPAYTVRELVHHLRDSGSKVLCTQKGLLGVALEAAREVGIPRGSVVVVDEKVEGLPFFRDLVEDGERDRGGDGEVEGLRAKLDAKRDLAYLVYSSGTTGLPKGVMLTHCNVVSNLFMLHSSEGELLKWNRDRILSVLPFFHIYGLQCLVQLPAFAGITTTVMQSFDLKQFCSIVQNSKITYTYLAPPVILHLAKNPIVAEYDLSSLKMITSGAAPLTKELINAVHERLGVEVKQAYGLSETSPGTHIQKKWNDGVGSNGPPLPNQIVKYMSPDGDEVPRGTQGEIWVKGPHVFVGYHNNASATAGCMTPDGFFKTGDIGREDERGNMYITDRVKELIKYKGFQVAPAELEGILMGMELVDDVAVIGVQDDAQATEVPMAFVVPAKGVLRSRENEEVIVRSLDKQVAGHKRLRGGVRWIAEIPKSASGKILRRVLKDLLKEEERKKREEAKAKL